MAQITLNSSGVASNGSLLLQSNGTTTAVTIDTAQNMGLGVTPSAWGGSFKALQVGLSTSLYNNTTGNGTFLGSNFYWNGSNNIYINSNFATAYGQTSGSHQWFTAATGTAGGTVSFTQAMTLDADGDLGIGTTSPAQKLHVAGNVYVTGDTFRIKNSASNTAFIRAEENASTAAYTYATMDGRATGYWAFSTNDTERARIDSSGNLLVGTTSAYPTGSGLTMSATGYWASHVTGTASGTQYAGFDYAGVTIGSITQSGTTAVLYNVTSDQRLKENIVDAPEFGSVIDSLKVRSFDWKADQTHQRAGFIAQELLTVAPEAVHQPEDTEAMMAVDYSKLVPMLVKEIQSLRKRIAALESN